MAGSTSESSGQGEPIEDNPPFNANAMTTIFQSRGLPPDPEEPEGSLGRYELLLKVGQGGFGRVYKARDRENGEIVAVKILRSVLANDRETLGRFKREFRATTALRHENIIRAIDIGQEGFEGNWVHFLVMEFVDGLDLASALNQHAKVSEDDVFQVMRGIGSAVHYAHEAGFVHRDIKPQNILLPLGGVAKLSDFGLVKRLDVGEDESELTLAGAILGTRAFMPPEQSRDAKTAGPAADIYALAMTALLMLSGRLPFQSEHSADWLKEKDEGLVIDVSKYPELAGNRIAAIRRSLSPFPADRHPDALAFVLDLIS